MPKRTKSFQDMEWVDPCFGDFTNSVIDNNNQPEAFVSTKEVWVDEYAPTKRSDLAVHKKKIEEVYEAISKPRKKNEVLILNGPAGSGKTATVKVLAKEKGIPLREWANISLYQAHADEMLDIDNSCQQFEEFFILNSKYSSVCGASTGLPIILIEELPNVYLRNPQRYHNIIRKFCEFSQRTLAIFPITDSNSKDTLYRSLFPPSLINELQITVITFNRVAVTLMSSALNRIISLACKDAKPSKELMNRFTEGANGDIRNAINSLQFTLCKGRKKEKKKKEPICSMANGYKDSSLDLFRAIGKVLYCKRSATEADNLRNKYRRFKLVEDPDEIFDKTGESVSKFVSYLHHNSPQFFSSINNLEDALAIISDSDVISSYWTPSNTLEDYGSSIAIRGLMFNIDSKSNKYRPLTGSQWFNILSKSREKMDSLRHQYRKTSIVNDEQLALYISPYTKIIKGKEVNGFEKPHETSLAEKSTIEEFDDPPEDFQIDDFDE